jgi:hypothetical protein
MGAESSLCSRCADNKAAPADDAATPVEGEKANAAGEARDGPMSYGWYYSPGKAAAAPADAAAPVEGEKAAVPAEAAPVEGEKANAEGARDGPMSYGWYYSPGKEAAVPAEAPATEGEKANAEGARDGPMSYGCVMIRWCLSSTPYPLMLKQS